MYQRTLRGASPLLPLLALVTLFISGLAPAASAGRQQVTANNAPFLSAPPVGSEADKAGQEPALTQEAVSQKHSAMTTGPMITVSQDRFGEVTVNGAGAITTTGNLAELSAKATVIPETLTATRAAVYIPPRETPAPLTAADLCDETQGQVSVQYMYSESLRRNLRYRIYLPPCYDEAGRLFPVLYMFHGLNYGDSQWDTIGLDELADAKIATGTMAPMIIVMPNIWGIDRYPVGGPGSVEEAIVKDLLPFVDAEYCAWNERQGRAIGGLSRGAYWALEIAFRYPNLFASVGGHSPAVFWDNAPPHFNPYYLVDDAPGLESLRIFLDLGEQDWLNRWVGQFLERMDERGLAYTFSTAPGDHGYAYWRSQLAAYLDFYADIWPRDWRELPTPLDCTVDPGAPGCRNGLGPGRPCDVSLP